jgi:hypothetical protein
MKPSGIIKVMAAIVFVLSGLTTAYAQPVTGSGNGVTNTVPKFNGPSSITNSLIFDNGTRVGIGTTNPLAPLHVGNGTDNPDVAATTLLVANNGFAYFTTRDSLNHVDLLVGTSAVASGVFCGLFGTRTHHDLLLQAAGNNYVGVAWDTGNVQIGYGTTHPDPAYKLDVNGSLNVVGNIAAKYQDVAEWVPASSQMPPGTVVVLNTDKNNEVMPSAHAYDTMVAGVVSEKPGMLLGESGPDKAKIATTGRVRVRVDATKNPIHVGDLLVTSDKPGLAMLSQPMMIQGRKFHQPGTLIGKALEPLAKGEGEILILLSLQ